MRAILLAACWLLLAPAFALAQAVQDVPELTARVTDLTGTLRQNQLSELEQRLEQLEQDTGGQVAVLMVNSTAPEDIAAYSIRVVDAWQLGREKFDDGVLFLVAKNDRRMRIEVGYGLEGAITDAHARRIIDEMVAPQFRKGEFFGGIASGCVAIEKLIRGEELPPPRQKTTGDGKVSLTGLLPLMIVLGVFVGGVIRPLLGRVKGSLAVGGLLGLITYALVGTLAFAATVAVLSLALSLVTGGGRWSDHGGFGGGFGSGGFGGGLGGGGFGGGGFGGGGGGFGGGGASGGW